MATEATTVIDDMVPSSGWKGAPNLDKLIDVMGEGAVGVVSVDDSDSAYDIPSGVSLIVCDTSGGALTLNLPAASDSTGRIITVVLANAGSAVTLDGDGAETINGNATDMDIDAANDTKTIICDGSEWFVISEIIAP